MGKCNYHSVIIVQWTTHYSDTRATAIDWAGMWNTTSRRLLALFPSLALFVSKGDTAAPVYKHSFGGAQFDAPVRKLYRESGQDSVSCRYGPSIGAYTTIRPFSPKPLIMAWCPFCRRERERERENCVATVTTTFSPPWNHLSSTKHDSFLPKPPPPEKKPKPLRERAMKKTIFLQTYFFWLLPAHQSEFTSKAKGIHLSCWAGVCVWERGRVCGGRGRRNEGEVSSCKKTKPENILETLPSSYRARRRSFYPPSLVKTFFWWNWLPKRTDSSISSPLKVHTYQTPTDRQTDTHGEQTRIPLNRYISRILGGKNIFKKKILHKAPSSSKQINWFLQNKNRK